MILRLAIGIATPGGACGFKNSFEKSRPFAFQCATTWRLSSICICPIISSNVPITHFGHQLAHLLGDEEEEVDDVLRAAPLKRLRSTGSCVATPTGQVLRWHIAS